MDDNRVRPRFPHQIYIPESSVAKHKRLHPLPHRQAEAGELHDTLLAETLDEPAVAVFHCAVHIPVDSKVFRSGRNAALQHLLHDTHTLQRPVFLHLEDSDEQAHTVAAAAFGLLRPDGGSVAAARQPFGNMVHGFRRRHGERQLVGIRGFTAAVCRHVDGKARS